MAERLVYTGIKKSGTAGSGAVEDATPAALAERLYALGWRKSHDQDQRGRTRRRNHSASRRAEVPHLVGREITPARCKGDHDDHLEGRLVPALRAAIHGPVSTHLRMRRRQTGAL